MFSVTLSTTRKMDPEAQMLCKELSNMERIKVSYKKFKKIMDQQLGERKLRGWLYEYKLLVDAGLINNVIEYSFSIDLKSNDFFGYASADSVRLDLGDYKWAFPIINKYEQDGVNAVMSHIRKADPLEEYITEKFIIARNFLIELNPKVWSEDD